MLTVAIVVALGGCATESPDNSNSDSKATGVELPLQLKSDGIAGLSFGTDSADVVDSMIATLGAIDYTTKVFEFYAYPDQVGYFADPPASPTPENPTPENDLTGLSWAYRYFQVACWQTLCLTFGGESSQTLKLRGWEISEFRRFKGETLGEGTGPDAELAETRIRLGDPWTEFQEAYTGAVSAGAEGNALRIDNPPWPGIFDGVGEWRLSGSWDYERPDVAPPDSTVTRMSAGQGPQPGCC